MLLILNIKFTCINFELQITKIKSTILNYFITYFLINKTSRENMSNLK